MNNRDYDSPYGMALFTDLYELTMAQAYHDEHMEGTAVFELIFREMPDNRNYIVAAGLADVLDYVSHFRFSLEDLKFLQQQKEFSTDFLRRLESLRFTGEIYAVPEGTVVFPNQPIVQVVAPLVEAQLFETWIVNQIHCQSLLASKASRIVMAAQGRMVIDFGARRAHGTDAAMKLARATYLAGGQGTSNVLAGKKYGIPIMGTMAHSYIQAHDNEYQAFEAFSELYPGTTLLVDTYDTLQGVQNVIRLGRKLGKQFRISAVRLDSGDLGHLALEARRMLDEAGLEQVQIFASSGLDEYEIQKLVNEGTPIYGFGVGTSLAVSEDAPAMNMAYKLVEYAGKGRLKLSSKKVLYPGRKQVFRQFEKTGMIRDVIARFDEAMLGKPLLERVFSGGQLFHHHNLTEARHHLQHELQSMPLQLLELKKADTPYPVSFSHRLQTQLDARKSELLPRAISA